MGRLRFGCSDEIEQAYVRLDIRSVGHRVRWIAPITGQLPRSSIHLIVAGYQAPFSTPHGRPGGESFRDRTKIAEGKKIHDLRITPDPLRQLLTVLGSYCSDNDCSYR